MTNHPDDLAFYYALADERSGGRGWRCPCCDYDEFWIISGRPRSPKCKKCRRVRSVTAGTILHHTRIPMWCWKDLIERHDQGLPPPTCAEAAERYQIADSSAWHLLLRVFRLRVRPRATGDVEILMLWLRCRRPSKEASIAAPAPIRALDALHHQPHGLYLHHVPFSVVVTADRAQCGDVGIVTSPTPNPSVEGRFLGRWLRSAMGGRRRPSLRWFPRWVAAWTALFTRWEWPHVPIPWTRLARSLGPVPLHAMDPWLAEVPGY